MQRIILPGEVGSAIEPRLTVDGLRNLIQDARKTPRGAPRAILVSEYDRREINQDLLAGSVTEVAKEDRRPEHDRACMGVIEGVPIGCHPDIPRGKARLVYGPKKAEISAKLGGEGLIIVGA